MAREPPCTPCQVNSAFGLAFAVCSTLKGANCKKLQADLNAGRIQKKTAIKKLISVAEAQGKAQAVKDLRRVARIIKITGG